MNTENFKAFLQQEINQLEALRDEIPFGLDDHSIQMIAALRIALNVVETSPRAWIHENSPLNPLMSVITTSHKVANSWRAKGRKVTPLYPLSTSITCNNKQ